jgi:outer membrane protein TolC
MRSPLPCLEFEPQCVSALQSRAIATSPLLKELDKRSQEIQEKIDQAKGANQQQINLSVFTPAVQYLLRVDTVQTPGQPARQVGFLERIGQLFLGETGIINNLLSVVGVPLIQAASGGNTETQRNSIAIADLQVKHAQMQRDRAELSDKVREAIAVAVLDFDTKAREFQISQEIAIRENQRFQLMQVSYRFGSGTTDNYLASESQLDGKKAQVFRAWSGMRSQLERIKLLVLGVKTE